MRRLIAIPCDGETLVATLDLPEAPGTCGLLIVSGGNEVRAGAHRGMAMLAARLAEDGVAVLRYDRPRGGQFEWREHGLAGRARRSGRGAGGAARHGSDAIAGYGNCDAAEFLLALEGRALGIDTLVLANPWTTAEPDTLPVAAIRATYARKLRHPSEWWRLLRGGVDLRKLLAGLWKLWRTPNAPPPLAVRVTQAIAAWRAGDGRAGGERRHRHRLCRRGAAGGIRRRDDHHPHRLARLRAGGGQGGAGECDPLGDATDVGRYSAASFICSNSAAARKHYRVEHRHASRPRRGHRLAVGLVHHVAAREHARRAQCQVDPVSTATSTIIIKREVPAQQLGRRVMPDRGRIRPRRRGDCARR
ncbi:hypothetical protein AB5I41_15965 [Sphingomonas sp. MMS24-JH45]